MYFTPHFEPPTILHPPERRQALYKTGYFDELPFPTPLPFTPQSVLCTTSNVLVPHTVHQTPFCPPPPLYHCTSSYIQPQSALDVPPIIRGLRARMQKGVHLTAHHPPIEK